MTAGGQLICVGLVTLQPLDAEWLLRLVVGLVQRSL